MGISDNYCKWDPINETIICILAFHFDNTISLKEGLKMV